MRYINLFEEFKIKPRATDVPVYSTGQRPVTANNKKVIRKQDVIVATNGTIHDIVKNEIVRLGEDADLNHINVSRVTNMNSLFYYIDFHGDVSQWDVSNVEDMSYMFEDCDNFNCDLSKWDVSKVKDMRSMFSRCYNFNQDLSSWDVRNVKDMNWMFNRCLKFNSDISKWDVGKVENMGAMFRHCANFNQDLSNWDVSNVECVYSMFDNCPIKEEYKPKFK